MTAPFLHGVETIEVSVGTKPIRGVKTAVIGLVGTAPMFAVASGDRSLNRPVLITSQQDATRLFGTMEYAGYSIPRALRAIFDQGRGIALVVNVFDVATHKTSVALADHPFTATDIITLGHAGLSTVVVKDSTGETTYVAGTDYTVDAVAGTVTRKASGAIAALATVKISYDYADVSAVDASDIIGATDGSGNRSGLQALDDAFGLFGFNAKILIAPAFSTTDTVVAALVARATQLRAIALVDAPQETTVAEAIAGRGPSGTINFESASDRLVLCYPWVSVDDGDGGTELEPYSSRLAGVIAARDLEFGYHWSPSNAEILGIVGIERRLTAAINDPSAEVNQLNEAGITTVYNAFGSGFRTWGNRSAAYPSSSDPTNFVAVRRTADVLHESIELAMLQFLDQPINDALIDAIRESVNGYIRTLIGRGALIDGSCTYDPADNPATEIAAGHLTFTLDYLPPLPLERITYKAFIDINLLSQIGTEAEA